jgi:hypothetical protein
MKKAILNSICKKMKTSLYVLSFGLSIAVSARENIPGTGGSAGHRNNNTNNGVMLAGCIAGAAQQEILLNDVRTRVLTDGDMWWDFSAGVSRYEVPKGSNSYAQFAGSLWFGGFENSVLHVAAMTYRQNGVDFWPGPVNPQTLSTDIATCQAYDRVWTFNRADVNSFYAYWNEYGAADPNTPTWIKDYPGNTSYPGENLSVPKGTYPIGTTLPMTYLAPYADVNLDGTYNYASGDYPKYNINPATSKVPRGQCVRYLFGDQTLFFVFNDVANKHGETGGTNNIGVEIRGQAFEFSTSDELNDMTFYNYEIINWSPHKLDSTYFTVWDDCDLGDYQDDYVGCDVSRGLGYQYNGENYDYDVAGQTGYHDKLPAIGCDFFQGPYADVGDSIDNDRDGCVDCTWGVDATGKSCPTCGSYTVDSQLPEQCVMSRFTYYNNATGINGNPLPNGGSQYYDLMAGRWENGTAMTYGASGLTGGNTPCKFLYPGTTDPLGWGLGYHPNGYQGTSVPGSIKTPAGSYGTSGWTEYQAGNQYGDRRFMQSAGKFTLQPGAVNYVTTGIPFVRSSVANYLAPLPALFAADDKAQSLFDNCFKVLDGPDAPDLTIQELNQQLLVTLTNNPYTSNNYEAKRYADFDPSIVLPTGATGDNVYRFEGYMVYQVLDNTISVTQLTNNNVARLIFQCDIKNGVGQLINYNADPTLGTVPQLMVTGADAGIENSFSIINDQFSGGTSARFVNFKNYYFMAVSYAYNNYLTYKQDVQQTVSSHTVNIGGTVTTTVITNNPSSGDINGQKKPFLQGRNNVKLYTAIPHDPAPEAYGTVMNSAYGSGPQVTRVEGQGNGGYALDLTDQSISDILASPVNRAQQITYVAGRSPVLVKVIDPLRVVKGNFTIKFITATPQASGSSVTWYYNGNPPIAGPATLDTGKVKKIPTMKWFMTGNYTDATGNNVTKTWLSDEGLSVAQEKIVTGLNNESLGFSVTIKQTTDPQQTGAKSIVASQSLIGVTAPGDLLESSIQYAGSSWLNGVQDIDVSPQDWILSGSNATGAPPYAGEDIFGQYSKSGKPQAVFADPNQIWESVVGGTWAPFRFVNTGTKYPAFSISDPYAGTVSNANTWNDTRLLASVDIIFTKDQSKWSRCPVVDMNPGTDPTTGTGYKWQLRKAPSVDKNGVANFPSTNNNDIDSSMSWFPGYAINVETGERLNIIFAENSADAVNNGTDMMWNPTSTILDSKGNIVNGGMHYVYILGHNSDGNFTLGPDIVPSDVRRYDAGLSAYQMLRGPASIANVKYSAYSLLEKQNKWCLLSEVFKDIMWTSMPLSTVDLSANSGDPSQSGPNKIPADAKVRIRVPKPFRYALSTVTSPANTSYGTPSPIVNLQVAGTYSMSPLNSDLVANLPYDLIPKPQNGNFPMYTFNTNDLVASTFQAGTAQSQLARINIVPNPYYAHSAYEQTRIDLEVKIINLPVKCTIKIYTLAGTLIRILNKDDNTTYTTWDLHNSANIQIASGLYILHIDAPGIGERILKWFGVMRPYDLQSF